MAKSSAYKGRRLSLVLDDEIYEILKIHAEKQNRPIANMAKSIIADFCNALPEPVTDNNDSKPTPTEPKP